MYSIDTHELHAAAAPPPLRTKSKEKEKERDKLKPRSSQKSQGERLKTVVRRLPPNLPEEVFWQSVQPWVTDETVTWKVFYPGKFRKRLNKENIPSRAYIAFRDEEILAAFSREYDGHLFRDKAGNESIAVVEFSPFQKVPTEKKKVDGRLGTIDKDDDFQSFLSSLKDDSTKPFDLDTLEMLAANTHLPPQPTTTPLLEALKAEKSAQKDKETILRAHAHYKDPAIAASASASKKDDKGKRGPSANPPHRPSETPQGKKSTKAPAKSQQHQQGAAELPTGSKKIAQNLNAQSSSTSKVAPPAVSRATPKSPRRNRDRERSETKAMAVPSHVPVQDTPTPSNSPLPVAIPTTILAASGTSSQPAAVAPARRTRPMLGLASRHFEAALSGAGVERKIRTQREQTKDKDGSEATNAAPATSTPSILQRDITPSVRVAQDPLVPPGGAREDVGGRGGGRGRGRGGRSRGGGRGG